MLRTRFPQVRITADATLELILAPGESILATGLLLAVEAVAGSVWIVDRRRDVIVTAGGAHRAGRRGSIAVTNPGRRPVTVRLSAQAASPAAGAGRRSSKSVIATAITT